MVLWLKAWKLLDHTKVIENNEGYYIKAMMKYENSQNELDTVPVWLYVNYQVNIDDVLAFIETHKENWVP